MWNALLAIPYISIPFIALSVLYISIPWLAGCISLKVSLCDSEASLSCPALPSTAQHTSTPDTVNLPGHRGCGIHNELLLKEAKDIEQLPS